MLLFDAIAKSRFKQAGIWTTKGLLLAKDLPQFRLIETGPNRKDYGSQIPYKEWHQFYESIAWNPVAPYSQKRSETR